MGVSLVLWENLGVNRKSHAGDPDKLRLNEMCGTSRRVLNAGTLGFQQLV